MDIVIKKSPTNKIFLPWLGTTGVTITIFALFHLALYYLFYTDSKTLTEHFANAAALYLYALIWPLAIVNNYKSSIIQVKHNGEVNPDLVKEYFHRVGFELIEQKPGHFRFRATKFWDRLFPGSRIVRVDFTDQEITIEMPFHQRYHVHHGFKFSNQFVRQP
jgi:hypothetical protein